MKIDPYRHGIAQGHIAADVACISCGFVIDVANVKSEEDARSLAALEHSELRPTCKGTSDHFTITVTTDRRPRTAR